jgi:hypothetical protein
MMDAADPSKTLVTMYELTQYHIPESLNFHSYVIKIAVFGKVRPCSLVDGLLQIIVTYRPKYTLSCPRKSLS